MGMYTELVMAIELKRDVPKQIIRTLYYMTGQEEEDILEQYGKPEHELFNTVRWTFMLQSDSYYFDGVTHSFLEKDNLIKDNPSYYLTIRCNLKNYNNEIDKFIDWIKPYSDTKGFIGYKRYEEDEEPNLIFI